MRPSTRGQLVAVDVGANIGDADGDTMEWLEELTRITDPDIQSIMAVESDWSADIGDDMAEVFSPPRILVLAQRMGVSGQWSIDKLTEMRPGEPWDLEKKAHQRRMKEIIEDFKPGLLIGSPPCSWFSSVMKINWPKISRARRHQMMQLSSASRMPVADATPQPEHALMHPRRCLP